MSSWLFSVSLLFWMTSFCVALSLFHVCLCCPHAYFLASGIYAVRNLNEDNKQSFFTRYILYCPKCGLLPYRIFGLQKMLYLNHWGKPGGETDQGRPRGLCNVFFVFFNVYYFCFNVRAEQEKIREQMKEEEQPEEVDDSGFFAGEATPLFQPVVDENLQISPVSSSLPRPLSRWSSPSGGCDHHHERWASERDQSRGIRWSHDGEGVWKNTAVSICKFRPSKSQTSCMTQTAALSPYLVIWPLIGCSVRWGWLPGTEVSAHASWDVWGAERSQGCESGWWGDN